MSNKDPYNENATRGLSASIDAFDTEACIKYFLERTKGLSRYILMDAYESDPLWKDLSSRRAPLSEWKQARLSVHTKTGGPQDPWLLNLNEDNTDFILRRVLEWVADEGRSEYFPLGPRFFSGLIGAEVELETLVWHLNMNGRYHLPGREKDTAFRFFDPRVMHTLMRILTPQQRILLLGGARCWAYVDFQSRFRMRENTRYMMMSKVMLKPEQINVLKHNGRVYEALRYLRTHRDLWTENTDVELTDYIMDADLKILHSSGNFAAWAALKWLIYRGRASEELLAESVEILQEATGLPLKDVIDSRAPGLMR
jgi:hypothetical protein